MSVLECQLRAFSFQPFFRVHRGPETHWTMWYNLISLHRHPELWIQSQLSFAVAGLHHYSDWIVFHSLGLLDEILTRGHWVVLSSASDLTKTTLDAIISALKIKRIWRLWFSNKLAQWLINTTKGAFNKHLIATKHKYFKDSSSETPRLRSALRNKIMNAIVLVKLSTHMWDNAEMHSIFTNFISKVFCWYGNL